MSAHNQVVLRKDIELMVRQIQQTLDSSIVTADSRITLQPGAEPLSRRTQGTSQLLQLIEPAQLRTQCGMTVNGFSQLSNDG